MRELELRLMMRASPVHTVDTFNQEMPIVLRRESAVSRMSFFFTTLIAAIPAAFLGYLCVMAFLLHSDALPPIMMGVAGLTLLLCVVVVAMPVAVLLKTKDRAKPAEKSAVAEKTADEEAVEAEEDAVVADEEGDVFVEGDADEFDDFDEKK